MIAASFDESNCVIGKPADMDDDACSCLAAMRLETENGLPALLSCWKLTVDELKEVNRTGRVWLTVLGDTMPPVALDGIKPIRPLRKEDA